MNDIPTTYDIIPDELPRDEAIQEIIKRVRSGEIWFPFNKYLLEPPHELFQRLKTIDLSKKIGNYRLRSYYPQYGSFLPPKFRGIPTIIAGINNTADLLSDHFIENVRLRAKRYDQNRSILECWETDSCLEEIIKFSLNKSHITPQSLRDSIRELIPETKNFNPTWAKALLKLVMGNDLRGKKWLDISAGWGDRLITAISLDMDYVGFDPNIDLEPGHSQIINLFGDNNRHKVIYEPFEKADIPSGPYDVILSSPPYFTVEEYVPNQNGQSIVNYPDFNQWMVWFLFQSLTKAWDNLKDNGYLILHLGDAKTIRTSEPCNIFIENNLPGASWEGVIGLQSESGYPRPVWVWKKLPYGIDRNIWEPQQYYLSPFRKRFNRQEIQIPFSKRTLFNTYPSLQCELLKYYASKYAPHYLIHRKNASCIRKCIKISNDHIDDLLISSLLETIGVYETIKLSANIPENIHEYAKYYMQRKNNAIAIRDHVSLTIPHISREYIDKLFNDDLMISCLLETLSIEDTIKWAIEMTQITFRQ